MRGISLLGLIAILQQCSARPETGRETDRGRPLPGISTPPVQIAAIAGHWTLRRGDAAPQGMQLELVFDSVAGSNFRARITFLMQGNLGLDASLFEPAVGSVGPDSTIRVSFSSPRREVENRLGGRLRGDTVTLTEFFWAREDWLRGGTPWVLVREPR